MNNTVKITLASLTVTVSLLATTPAIGVVQAEAAFRVNQSTAYGNSTLFDGALLETMNVRSDVTLSSGGRIAVGPNSKTHIYKTYAVLESGAMDVNAASYSLKAASLSISGTGAQVVLDTPTKLRVGALSAPIEVRNASDMLIARVMPGHALEFETAGGGQGGASGPVTISGTLVKEGTEYKVTDDKTNVTYVVTGKDLDKKVGKKVKVTGAVVAGSGAVPVVAATSIALVGAAVAGAGLGAAAITGIVIAGATGVGLGVAAGTGAFDSSSPK